jgi:hypothetical protein
VKTEGACVRTLLIAPVAYPTYHSTQLIYIYASPSDRLLEVRFQEVSKTVTKDILDEEMKIKSNTSQPLEEEVISKERRPLQGTLAEEQVHIELEAPDST